MKSTHLKTDDAYDIWAKTYDEYDNPMIAMCEVAFAQSCPTVQGMDVVEFGCGTGRNLAHFSKAGAKSLVGLDFSAGMLDKAKELELPNTRLVQHDISERAPLEDETADLVTFMLVLEHIEDLSLPLKEALRVLRRGGGLFIAEIHPYLALKGAAAHFEAEGVKYTMPTHTHDVSHFINGLCDTGFSVEKMNEWRPSEKAIEKSDKVKKHGDVPYLLSLLCRKPSRAVAP
jgi:malonyl-CoA O-methyltransferase